MANRIKPYIRRQIKHETSFAYFTELSKFSFQSYQLKGLFLSKNVHMRASLIAQFSCIQLKIVVLGSKQNFELMLS